MRWLLLHEPAVEVLRGLLGSDFVVVREAACHLNQFGGWHKDTSTQETAGRTFHRDKDYLMVEAAYYLQDNTSEYGGGLDVEPGSHREPDQFVALRKPGILRKVAIKLGKYDTDKQADALVRRPHTIPSKAGDLVIFDFRISHRATQPRIRPVPGPHEKIAIFCACSANTRHVGEYHHYNQSELGRGEPFPEDLRSEAAKRGLTLG
jgi:hypothetical protein